MEQQDLKKCAKCILPETFPKIKFDENGVCNYCRDHKKFVVKGEKALEEILSKHRNKGGKADCIVTISGGRDSSFVLYKLVKEFNMRVLAVTYDWGIMTPEAERNWRETTKILGVEHIIIKPDTEKIKKHIRINLKAWLKKPHLGMIWLFTQADKQAEYHINKIAKKFQIPLIVTGAGSQFEITSFKYAFMGVKFNDNITAHLPLLGKIKLLLSYGLEYLRNPRYINESIVEVLKSYFIQFVSDFSSQTKWIHFYRYYLWNEEEIVSTIKTKLNWKGAIDNPSLTWRIDDATAPLYNYLHFKMAGFTEHDTFFSHKIREGLITREEALKRVKEENRPRKKAIERYLKLLSLSFEDFKDLPKIY